MYNPIYIYNLFFLNAQLNHFYFINYYLKKKTAYGFKSKHSF